MNELPKILILSRSFRSGDAITTLHFFNQWPKDKLYCASPVNSPFESAFKEYYRMGSAEMSPRFPFNIIGGGLADGGRHSYDNNVAGQRESFLRKTYRTIGIPFLRYIGQYENRWNIKLSDEFENWVNKIKPDVIYTSLGDSVFANFVLSVKERFPEIPIVIHGFDDWTQPSYNLIFRNNFVKKASALIDKCFDKADLLFTSSDKMNRDFSKRFNKSFQTFTNPVDLSLYKDLEESLSACSDTIRILYIGKISTHNASAIKNMSESLANLNQEYSGKILFDIYTQSKTEDIHTYGIKANEFTSIHPPVPNEEVALLIQQHDILFLPISTDENIARFTRYSMSTKMGEYLASERPVLYCGPSDIAMTEFLKDNKCAVVKESDSSDDLTDGIKDILNNPSIAATMAERGKVVASNEFDMVKVTADFTKAILNIKQNSH